MTEHKNGRLYWIQDGESVLLEAWGDHAIRVRATRNRSYVEKGQTPAEQIPVFAKKNSRYGDLFDETGKVCDDKQKQR